MRNCPADQPAKREFSKKQAKSNSDSAIRAYFLHQPPASSPAISTQILSAQKLRNYFVSGIPDGVIDSLSKAQPFAPTQAPTQSGNSPTIQSVHATLSISRTPDTQPIQDDWRHTQSSRTRSAMKQPSTTPDFAYRVGGSLAYGDSSYVIRQADVDLMAAVHQGQFAYVFGPRQIGKSSLRIQARHQLETEGYTCATIQANQLSDRAQSNLSSGQYTTRFLATLWDSLQPAADISVHKTRLAYLSDTATQADTSQDKLQTTVKRLHHFVQTVLVPLLQAGPLVIFIDEVDALLHTPFAAELFDWIETCYQSRTDGADSTVGEWYQNLNFVVLGSAIATKLPCRETLFSTHSRIAIEPFKLSEAEPLQHGFAGKIDAPEALVKAIFYWTQGQPFLTQKICYILQILMKRLVQTSDKPLILSDETVQQWVNEIVRSHIIKDWPNQDEPIHLRAISDRITRSPNKPALKALYKRIYAGVPVALDNSHTQAELLLSGIVTMQCNQLQIANEIYRHVFPLR